MRKARYYRDVWDLWDVVIVAVAVMLAVFLVLFASRATGDEPSPPKMEMIVSPWQGMFAAGENFGDVPFVEVGSHVTPQTVVGVVYLDVMEPVRQIKVLAGVQGTIVQVLVEDGAYVEAGQPLMVVELDREVLRAPQSR